MARLAADGMTFTHAFVASPSCAPSRAALLTGLDPMRNGAMLNHSRPRADVKTWPAYFHDLGYEVVAIGKTAHLAADFAHAATLTKLRADLDDWMKDRGDEGLKTERGLPGPRKNE